MRSFHTLSITRSIGGSLVYLHAVNTLILDLWCRQGFSGTCGTRRSDTVVLMGDPLPPPLVVVGDPRDNELQPLE